MTTLYGSQLVSRSTTLRESVFARLLVNIVQQGTGIELSWKQIGDWTCSVLVLPCAPLASADDLHLGRILADVQAGHGEPFTRIPFAWKPEAGPSRDLELIEALQELANLIAAEGRDAFRADYYPGVPDVDAISDEHVSAIMVAMQREMDREGKSRSKQPIRYADLPFERQRALAERRRYWYGQFGITPQSWPSGVFSLWAVQDIPFPELIKGKLV